MTGELRAALEVVRGQLQPDQGADVQLAAFRSLALAVCRAIEVSEDRRQRFEARVAEKIREFEAILEEKASRNLRIRFMRFQLEELQRAHNELRERMGAKPTVWETDFEREERTRLERESWNAKRGEFFAKRKAAREAARQAKGTS